MSAKKVADALGGVLADTYVLFTKTQNYHWNVVGPYFHSLHLLFEEQYRELFGAIDEVAERIRQLGHPAPGTQAEFLRTTVLSENAATIAAAMVADLAACHQKVGNRVAACLKLADQDGDDGTVDLMVRRLEAHSKAGWMLRATLGEETLAGPPAAAPVGKAPPSKPVKAKKKKPAKSKAATAAVTAKKAPTTNPKPKTAQSPAKSKPAAKRPATKSKPALRTRPKAARPQAKAAKAPTAAVRPSASKPAKKKNRVALG